MRKILIVVLVATLTACGSGGDDNAGNGPISCTNGGQKEFVADVMWNWYLWTDLLPGRINGADFATPEDLLAYLTTFSPNDGTGPVDTFSYIGSAAADEAYFGEGKYEGFGFSWKFVDVNEARLTRVFEDSPAFAAGLARGQTIVALDGRSIAEIEAAEGLGAAFDEATLDFTMREVGGAEFTVTITQGVVTINPVPQWGRIQRPVGPDVGYVELATFVSTADPALDTVFADFRANGVNDLILDLRYNGGGLVGTAELLADYLGGDVAENLVFSRTLFNAYRARANNRTEFFDRLANSMSLSRLVVIATQGTASASELVTNGMAPHVDVVVVGDRTFGKPVGQVGFEFCGKILRPVAFQTVNADGDGDYFGGLPVDCPADDDLDVAVGADTDPNLVAALSYLDTGACHAAVAQRQPGEVDRLVVQPGRRGGPWREFAGAY